MKENGKLRCQMDGSVAILTFHNPPINLLDTESLIEIKDAFEELGKNTEVRAIVFTAEGKGFISGADVNDLALNPDDEYASRFGQSIMNAIEACPVPTIAAVDGYCFGGGVEVIMSCDIRLASPRARFKMPETGLGFPITWGGSTRLPLIVGEAWAKWMIFSAQEVSAEKAERIGLVQEICESEDLLNYAVELAKKMAANAPIAIRITKKHMLMMRSMSFEAALRDENGMAAYNAPKEDSREGFIAFLEKRPPVYKNC